MKEMSRSKKETENKKKECDFEGKCSTGNAKDKLVKKEREKDGLDQMKRERE